MTFTVYWQTKIGLGFTFYNGCLTIRAADKEEAADFARRKIARDFPERGSDCVQITNIDSLTETISCPR